jgi:CrcB protein
MGNIILVAVGGSLGALSRYGLSTYIARQYRSAFPWGTLVINLTGCFLIGLAFALGFERNVLGPSARLACMARFLGAYTTFFTYALESVNFAGNGTITVTITNIVASTLGGSTLVGMTAASG